MTCPSWSRLVAHRYDGPAACEPEGWEEALEHLGSCTACRDEALAADPSLAFRSLPEEPVTPDDVEQIRAGVDALRRASRVESEPPAGSRDVPSPWNVSGARPRPRGRRSAAVTALRRARWPAAAAVLAAALLSVHPDASGPLSSTRGPAPVDLQALLWANAAPDLPSGDDIDRPNASVYHFDDRDLTVTMVVDPTLDV